MPESRIALFREITRNRFVRFGGTGLAALAAWDVFTNQFGFAKIPEVWNMTGAVLPLWAWIALLQSILIYGLFEYIRLRPGTVITEGAEETFEDHFNEAAATIDDQTSSKRAFPAPLSKQSILDGTRYAVQQYKGDAYRLQDYLERDASYMKIKKHLSDQFKTDLSRAATGRVAYSGDTSGRLPQLARELLEEIDVLAKEWGLE